MSEAGQTDPNLAARDRYAEEFNELSTPDLLAMKEMLGNSIGQLEDFSFDNPLHVDLRNRFLGTTLALRGRLIEAPQQDTKSDEPDDEPPSYMLRVDGGVDVVSAAGVSAYEKDGRVPRGEIITTFSSKNGPERTLTRQSPVQARVTAKRRVII